MNHSDHNNYCNNSHVNVVSLSLKMSSDPVLTLPCDDITWCSVHVMRGSEVNDIGLWLGARLPEASGPQSTTGTKNQESETMNKEGTTIHLIKQMKKESL